MPSRYISPLVTARAERLKRQRRLDLGKKLLAVVGVILFILALGVVGNNDLETELMERGYTHAEAQDILND